MSSFNIYTDGSCRNTKGGWSVYVKENNISICGSEENTTNNSMELKAIYAALEYIVYSHARNCEITIHTDSQYCIGVITQNYTLLKHEQLINQLKRCIAGLKEKRNVNISFNKVKGHNHLPENELCDFLAKQMSE